MIRYIIETDNDLPFLIGPRVAGYRGNTLSSPCKLRSSGCNCRTSTLSWSTKSIRCVRWKVNFATPTFSHEWLDKGFKSLIWLSLHSIYYYYYYYSNTLSALHCTNHRTVWPPYHNSDNNFTWYFEISIPMCRGNVRSRINSRILLVDHRKAKIDGCVM